MGEPDEEVAGAFPVFIRNAVLGRKQPKRTRPEPCRSTDAVSMASHKWQVPTLLSGPLSLAHSPLPSTLGKDRLRWSWRPDKIHPACILVLWHWAKLSYKAHHPSLVPPDPSRPGTAASGVQSQTLLTLGRAAHPSFLPCVPTRFWLFP